MEYIKGKFRQSIFTSETGYLVGIFKVRETSESLTEIANKTITFTGYFAELNTEDSYIFYGKYINHDRYGYQFQVESYEKLMPEGKDAIIEFLTSSLIKGCGEKTANKIVEILGDKAIDSIRENKDNLLLIPNLSQKKADSIYNSICKYYESNETIIKLKEYGFSIKDSLKLLNVYGKNILKVVTDNVYDLIEYIDFKTLDKVFFKIYDETNTNRILALIIESLKNLSFSNGDTYSYKEEITIYLKNVFNIDIEIDDYLKILNNEFKIVIEKEKIYLFDNYEYETGITANLLAINNNDIKQIKNFDKYLSEIEKDLNIKYNKEQANAIKTSLENNVSIITGGPGTGKTTLIKGILELYKRINKYNEDGLYANVALLAPTGRASKRLSETTNLGSKTIHRYLKWNKETNSFAVNEYNKNFHKLIIVDETSMIDTFLMYSLLNGIESNIKLILVGDENQLPSVNAGNVLNDLINTKVFNHIKLTNIYRQSDNSFIPILAKEIKNKSIKSNYLEKKDDYNFLITNPRNIKELVCEISKRSLEKGLDENDIQILAPMYKGENGIDNLNIELQEIFNPPKDNLTEAKVGNIIYRVGDKILNLVNDPDKNIYNGDIGFISEVNIDSKKDFLIIDFYNNHVSFKREDLNTLKHAYAISIHKSQGSEFNHVIIPITKAYNKMLYNKLIYTAVSRAKKSLVLIGSPEAFIYAVNNDQTKERKTTLKDFILHKSKKTVNTNNEVKHEK